MKKQVKQSKLRPRSSNSAADTESTDVSNVNSVKGTKIAKIVTESKPIALSGVWQTCGQDVLLKFREKDQMYIGDWGVNTLVFMLKEREIVSATLGSMDLLCGGTVSLDDSCIFWGNGQVWVRE